MIRRSNQTRPTESSPLLRLLGLVLIAVLVLTADPLAAQDT